MIYCEIRFALLVTNHVTMFRLCCAVYIWPIERANAPWYFNGAHIFYDVFNEFRCNSKLHFIQSIQSQFWNIRKREYISDERKVNKSDADD